MQKKDVILATAAVAGFLSAAVSHIDFSRSREEAKPEPAQEAETPQPAAPARQNGPQPLKIEKYDYDGSKTVTLHLNARPDMDAAKSYISVDPEPSNGWFVVESVERDWSAYPARYRPGLKIHGDFPFGGKFAVRISEGLPARGGEAAGDSAEGVRTKPMAEKWERVFKRENLESSVSFKNAGRYLPPAGKRLVALEAVNCGEVDVSVSRIPSANIVQMLALEEDAYGKITKMWYGSGDSFATDLSGMAWNEKLAIPSLPNKPCTAAFSLLPRDGGPSNGVFSIEAQIANSGRLAYKTVCVSDLGLSVREAKKGLYAWVVSLSTGLPVADVEVVVYSSANIPVARGRTGIGGFAFCEKERDDSPFAAVATSRTGDDMTFVALAGPSRVEESTETGERYLDDGDLTAFAWTDRGIYRHGEKIFFEAIVRNGRGAAPERLPLSVGLCGPLGRKLPERTVVTDATGGLSVDALSVPEECPGGNWRIVVKTPGDSGRIVGERTIKVEEFAPPHIRVAASPDATRDAAAFGFTVSAENLYGGPAAGLACEGAAVFEDVPFEPAGWEGWTFGDESRSLAPGRVNLDRGSLGDDGKFHFEARLPESAGKASAAVRATVQGTVFEDGGRPATCRTSAILHQHPFYIGSTLGEELPLPAEGRAKIRIACVMPDGTRFAGAGRLEATLEKEDRICAYTPPADGRWATWKCDKVRTPLVKNAALAIDGNGEACYEIPADVPGEYFLKIRDAGSGASFARRFHLGETSAGSGTADLAKPASASVSPAKDFYRPGEIPRLKVRAPFAGTALVTVCRDDVIYAEAIELESPDCEIALHEAGADWWPNVDVSLCVVRGADAPGALALKAHGETKVCVRRQEDEIPVSIAAARKGRNLEVEIDAPGAVGVSVAAVDEGINLMTMEPAPDPIAFFSKPRRSVLPVYDIYRRLLPVYGSAAIGANGLKTGGGAAAGLLDRISPVASRRFKPLALWSGNLEVAGGKCKAVFELPEFSGEIRLSAVARSARASGAAVSFLKVKPKLVAMPDAPRFAAPGDRFKVSLPLANESGGDGEVEYSIELSGAAVPRPVSVASGKVTLAAGGKKTLRFDVVAPAQPGEIALSFTTSGFGEKHEEEILLPVRPAAPWRETAGFAALGKGESFRPDPAGSGAFSKFFWSASANAASKLKSSLEWLAEYPYGCLEQTSSRIFPLVCAGGVLNTLGSSKAADCGMYVESGVRRVESMVRQNGFVMWPDCDYAPWDDEVSLYAAHFLVEAWKATGRRDAVAGQRVDSWLRRMAMSHTNSVSAYACHTLALAGKPEKDRMYSLYDARAGLDLLSRARLARAFAATGDRKRALSLLGGARTPGSVKEAAFALLALLETDAEGDDAEFLAGWLERKMDPRRMAWGTTCENAHALIAFGEYWRRRGFEGGTPKVAERDGAIVNEGDGTAFVSWRRLDLPSAADCKDEESGISIKREFLAADGSPYDILDARCGDLVVSRITVRMDETRDLNDLVIQDLFPGALEPVHSGVRMPSVPEDAMQGPEWVMRSDARDDRMLVFSKKFRLEKGARAVFQHPLRVVSAGDFALPAVSVEAMYEPALRASSGAGRARASIAEGRR